MTKGRIMMAVSHIWRNEPITEKQQQMITDMQEFAEYPLEPFNGKTKGEASDWISRNIKRAHEGVEYRDDYGDIE